MGTRGALSQGRDAAARQRWHEAFTLLSAADETEPLGPEDLEHLATAAYLLGRDDDRDRLLARACDAFADQGAVTNAARCAFWLGLGLLMRGEVAPGGGWLARAHRLVEHERVCVEQGYLGLAMALQQLHAGDAGQAGAGFRDVAAVAAGFGDADLLALARLGLGQSLIAAEEAAEGMALLDEAMVGVLGDEVSVIPAGIIYCAVIAACHEVFDVRRAKEWTAALSSWCAQRPEVVPYRGQCLIHRAQIHVLQGAWGVAMDEAQQACELLAAPHHAAAGEAHYQRAELHRLRGEWPEAEDAYRQASRAGRSPLPGLAQLRVAQGRLDAADASL
jgi:tetratricopeptide (TPR) repeat protein